jgi:hypothetical protein
MNKLFLTFMVIIGVASCANTNKGGDYYNSGDVITLHRHTVGNGIAIVIMGDGFDREDCRKGGVYEDNCRKLADLFLAMPVVRDFKDCFDVLARVDVSGERGARNCVADTSKCPDNTYGVGHPDLDWDKISRNSALAAGKEDRSVIFMGNGMIGGAAYGYLAVYSANEPNKLYWMMHEFAGHIIGCMPDMYVDYDEGHADSAFRKAVDDNHAAGELLMIDWRNDPKTVYWKDFIGRPGYEKVGVFPSGYYGIKFDEVFASEDHKSTVMSYGTYAYFTVMERYQLWRKIQLRAGFSAVSLDKFIEYDAVNVKVTDWSWTPYKHLDWSDDRVWNN